MVSPLLLPDSFSRLLTGSFPRSKGARLTYALLAITPGQEARRRAHDERCGWYTVGPENMNGTLPHSCTFDTTLSTLAKA